MSMFKSYQKYETRQKKSPDGAPLFWLDGPHKGEPMTERIEIPCWSTDHTIDYLRHQGRELTRTACRDSWHINLLDFVQHQHRLPNQDECEQLVLDFQKIEQATEHSRKRREILEKREAIKTELTKPLQLKATG